MAVLSPTQSPPSQRSHATPLALWHLLSLDAPTVAVLWTWFLARVNHLHLPALAILSMALAVWMLYATDRLLDARFLDARTLNAHHPHTDPLYTTDFEPRHHFHHRHRSAFVMGILIASTALAILIPRIAPEALHLYLILGVLLAGYFILIHATGSAHRLPKEIAVGLFFSAAVFIPTIARAPSLRSILLPPAALLALLCSLNCLFIYRWEHPDPAIRHRAHPLTRAALRSLHPLTIALATTAALYTALTHTPITLAISLSALFLLLLDHRSKRLGSVTLRAAADLALTTPILFVPHLLRIH